MDKGLDVFVDLQFDRRYTFLQGEPIDIALSKYNKYIQEFNFEADVVNASKSVK